MYQSNSFVKKRHLASRIVAALLCFSVFSGLELNAMSRNFTFVYEVTTPPPGSLEFEQWVTWKTDKNSDSTYERFDFRSEIEYGITEHWMVAFYLSDYKYQSGDSVSEDGLQWQDVAIETIYNLSSPVTDIIGSAVYAEGKIGDKKAEVEFKLLLQKNFGPWIIAWNGVFEAEWEGKKYDEKKGVLGNDFGVSYSIIPAVSAGFEVVHEVAYKDWSHWGKNSVYIGPKIVYRNELWWFGITPTFQVTDVGSKANYMTRLIAGINF